MFVSDKLRLRTFSFLKKWRIGHFDSRKDGNSEILTGDRSVEKYEAEMDWTDSEGSRRKMERTGSCRDWLLMNGS
jgi:hypothetical protein